MSSPTGVAPAAIDPPVPNRMTRIIPAPAAVKAKDNFNMGVMPAVSIVIAAVCFWVNHSVPGYLRRLITCIVARRFKAPAISLTFSWNRTKQ